MKLRLAHEFSAAARRMAAAGLVTGWVLTHLLAGSAAEALDAAKLAQMGVEIDRAIAQHQLPGGVLWVESKGHSYHRAFGARALTPRVEPMTEDTIFDTASLTKVLATAPAVMLLCERGKLRLDEPAATYLPDFGGAGKASVTLRQLLTHTSGLGRTVRGFIDWSDFKGAFGLVCAAPPANPPGTTFLYSDLNFIVLGEIVERVSGMRLDDFVAREIFEPLGMADTSYRPPAAKRSRIAPTTRVGDGFLRGTVHDFKARGMGGVAGHAGVFTTAADLARFSRMLLEGGTLEGHRLFTPETVHLMTRVQTPAGVHAQRGLGWDIDSDYSRPRGRVFPIGSYGMTGFTGVCLWIDPGSETFWFLLSNRVHPDQSGNIGALQRTLGTLAAEAAHVGAEPGEPKERARPSADRRTVPHHAGCGTSRVAPSRRIAFGTMSQGQRPVRRGVTPRGLQTGDTTQRAGTATKGARLCRPRPAAARWLCRDAAAGLRHRRAPEDRRGARRFGRILMECNSALPCGRPAVVSRADLAI